MKKLKTIARKAAPRKGSETTAGLRKKQTKATPSPPRWLAPRPFFGAAVAASQKAGSGGSSGVTVEMKGRDLGIDMQGFRMESQQAPTTKDNKFSWTHGAPALPPIGQTLRGQTLPHDMKDEAGNPIPKDQPWPNYWTMVVKVTPADQADQITFDKGGDEPDCIRYWLGPGVPEKGEIWVQVTALKATTSIEKNGKRVRRPTGALIVAKYKGVPVAHAQANFYVLRPGVVDRRSEPVKPGTTVGPGKITWCAAYEGQPVSRRLNSGMVPPEHIIWINYYVRFITVNVTDQYGDPLAAFYSGTSVIENGTWIAWSKGAAYSDPVGNVRATSKITHDKQGVEVQEFYLLEDTAFGRLPWTVHLDHKLTVAGWPLDNGNAVKRLFEIQDVTPPSKNPGRMPKSLGYRLTWE